MNKERQFSFRWPHYIAMLLLYWTAMYGVNAWYYPDTDWRKMLFVSPLYLTVVAVALWSLHRMKKSGGVMQGLVVYGLFLVFSYGFGLAVAYVVAPALNIRLHREGVPFSFADYTLNLLQFHYTYIQYALIIFLAERGMSLLLRVRNQTRRGALFRRGNRKLARQNRAIARDLSAKKTSLHFLGNLLHRLYAVGNKSEGNAPIEAWDGPIGYTLETQGVAGHSLVALSQELNIMREMMVTDGVDRKITLAITGKLAGYKIPRLTLITCYENMLKHGDLADPRCAPTITLAVSRHRMDFVTKNKVAASKAWTTPRDGSGLAKIRKNLELSLADTFNLDYGAENGCFTLRLTLYR